MDPSFAKKCARTYPDFIPEFQTYSHLEHICYDLIEFKMQCLWIIERCLSKPGQSRSLQKLAEFNLYNYFFEPEYNFNSVNLSEEFFEFYGKYFNNFNKMCQVWTFGLSIQLEYLAPYDPSTLRNFIGLCSFVKMAQMNNLFCKKENLSTLINLVCNLIQMFIFILSGSSNNCDLKYKHNEGICLRICVYFVRFVAELIMPEEADMIINTLTSSEEKSRVQGSVKRLVRVANEQGLRLWQFVFRADLIKRLPHEIISEYVYEGNFVFIINWLIIREWSLSK